MKQEVSMIVNGERITRKIDPNLRLVDFLREDLGLTGTKEGCGVGACGACTIIMDGKTVNSCLVLALSAEGRKIETIEGIGNKDNLHPIQESFMDKQAVQCGFCTPGFIMSAKSLLDENENPTRDEIREEISGNLCRCTGYDQIVDAIEDVSRKMSK